MARLAVRSPDVPETVHVLAGDTVRIGRSGTCEIVLADNTASREHCMFTRTPRGFTVADLGARNPASVNGRPLAGAVLLATGDIIRVGKTDLLYVCGPGEFAANGGTAEDDDEEEEEIYSGDADDDSFGGDSEIGRRIYEHGYRPLSTAEVAAAIQAAAPQSAGNSAASPQSLPASGMPGAPDAETMREFRAARKRNDKIAKILLFVFFGVLPFIALAAFVYWRFRGQE